MRRWWQLTTRLTAAVGGMVVLAGCRGVIPGRTVEPPPLAACVSPAPLPCYARDPLHELYQTGPLYARGITGAGTTIAVILPDASAAIATDLAVFSRHFRLPPARLQVVAWDQAAPGTERQPGVAGWDGEAALDLELAHFMAPGARLLLVRIPTSPGPYETGELRTAMTALGALAAGMRIDVAMFCWGEYEADLAASGDYRQLAGLRRGLRAAVASGVSVIAGSGDSGPTGPDPATGGFYRFRTVAWPTSDPLVTGVGGTAVRLTARGAPAGRPAAGRQDIGGHQYAGGGGLSAIFRRPAWQNRVAQVGDRRGVVDISMDARAWACLGVPGQPGSPGWTSAAGTSVSAPLLAGLVADAAQQAGHSLGLINPALYQMHGSADGITDITRGTNTDHGVPGYPARPGYDLPTGIGTIASATRFVTALIRLAGR